MVAILGLSFAYGSPYSVLYGADYGGTRCLNRKTFFPRLSEDLADQSSLVTAPWRLRLYGLCVDECPQKGDTVLDYGCTKYPALASSKACAGGIGAWRVPLDTVDIVNRCLPMREKRTSEVVLCAQPDCHEASRKCYTAQFHDQRFWEMDISSPADVSLCVTQARLDTELTFEASGAGPAEEQLAESLQGLNQASAAVLESKEAVIIFGILAPIALGFAFVLLLRCAAGPVIYSGIALLLAVLVGATILCAAKAGLLSGALAAHSSSAMETMHQTLDGYGYSDFVEPGTSAQLYTAATLALGIADTLVVVFICVFARNIAIAVEMVEAGSDVIAAQPTTLLYPFVTLGAMVCVAAYFVVGGVFIATIDNDALTGLASNITEATELKYGAEALEAQNGATLKAALGFYHLFGAAWTLNALLACGTTVVAGSVTYWFFARNDADEYPAWPLWTSLRTTLRYHLGTVLFGALVIAVVQVLRGVLQWVDEQTKDLQQANFVLKLLLKCVGCCMYCFERFVKFVSGYAYIYVALNGDSLCTACRATFLLFLNYPAQVAVNGTVQTVLRVVQCVAMPIACAVGCYYYADVKDGNINPTVPSVLALVLAYVVSRAISGVYEVVIDTVMVCVLLDKDKYEGRHTPDELKQVLGLKDTRDRARGRDSD